jgi:hypothetical protein
MVTVVAHVFSIYDSNSQCREFHFEYDLILLLLLMDVKIICASSVNLSSALLRVQSSLPYDSVCLLATLWNLNNLSFLICFPKCLLIITRIMLRIVDTFISD